MTNYDDWFQEDANGQSARGMSSEGLARRDAMRDSLAKTVVRRRRIRTSARATTALLLMLALVWGLTPEALQTPIAPGPNQLANVIIYEPTSTTSVTMVQDDSSILARLSVAPAAPTTAFLNDEQLLAQLKGAGFETGILRSQDVFMLTSDVSDLLSE